METVIIKFMKVMELRSVRMMRLVKEFAEEYRKENHPNVELTEGSQTPWNYYIFNYHSSIYDDVEIREYDRAGRGYQLLRLVNPNLRNVTDILGNILRYWTFNDGTEIEKQVMKLSKLLGVEKSASLQDLLSRASDMMDGPIKFYNGAGCYSISGMNTTSKYMDVLKENRFALHNENEYKIAEAFFEYLERRKQEV